MAMARRSVRVRGGVSRPSVSSACCSGAGGNTAKRRSIRTQGYGLLGNLHHVTRTKRENVVRGRKALSSARGAAAATSQKVATPTAASSSPAQSLTVSKLSKAFATTAVLLKDVSFTVNQGERVGLVGWNGAGKTTVLRIIRGEMEADAGDVRMMKNAKVASLNQEVRPQSTHRCLIMAYVSFRVLYFASLPLNCSSFLWNVCVYLSFSF